jgi:hypothetical protein
MSEAPPVLPPSGGRRKSKHPFTQQQQKQPKQGGSGDQERDNFPSMDSFFQAPNHDMYFQKPAAATSAVDQSLCSQDGSSILNMSIGARAALNEHMRHIAKFGIDGEQQQQPHEQPVVFDDNEPKNKKNALLDEQWDYLLDDHHDTSRLNDTIGSFAAVSSYPRFDISAADASGMESIEVMTDVSQDYFNSSSVKMLTTPERNLHRRDNHVVTREEVEDQEPFVEEDSDFETEASYIQNHNLAPELRIKEGISQHSSDRNDNSFQSFCCAADISRISNADSELRRSPNSSFLQEGQVDHRLTTHDELAFSLILDIASPTSQCDGNNESSFASSTPRRSPPKQDTTPKLPTVLGPSTNQKQRRSGKENTPHGYQSSYPTILNYRSSESPPPLSPPPPPPPKESVAHNAAAACSRRFHHKSNCFPQQKQERDGLSESSVSALDSMPADFLSAMVTSARASDAAALSPISQVESRVGGGGHNDSSSSTSQRRRRKTATSSSCLQLDKSSSSSSWSSLDGRRRYRTVVPRRVYMDGPPSDFPVEQDSFSTPPLLGEEPVDSPIQRSLLDSFEDAYISP